MAERLTFAVPEHLEGERLDRAVAVLGEMSRAAARRLVEDEQVEVDGRTLPPRTRLTAGQIVSFPPEEEAVELRPEPVELEVVSEDHHFLVVEKPPGLVVHPGAGQREGTLAAGILHRYPRVEGVGQEGRWGLVHRLDRDTSGLMVVALSEEGYGSLRGQVSARTMEREYLALVDGMFPVPTGTVDAPVSRDPARPTRFRVDPAGRPARTHYALEREYPAAGVSLIRARLETGRTHQIRVHLGAIDHPLAGDSLYRPGPDRVEVPRLFLHACRLAFDHPTTGERQEFQSPLPDDLAAALEHLP
ncbi:MAG: RluA family pseudouridine synthase [Actinomycetota bacterium]